MANKNQDPLSNSIRLNGRAHVHDSGPGSFGSHSHQNHKQDLLNFSGEDVDDWLFQL